MMTTLPLVIVGSIHPLESKPRAWSKFWQCFCITLNLDPWQWALLSLFTGLQIKTLDSSFGIHRREHNANHHVHPVTIPLFDPLKPLRGPNKIRTLDLRVFESKLSLIDHWAMSFYCISYPSLVILLIHPARAFIISRISMHFFPLSLAPHHITKNVWTWP